MTIITLKRLYQKIVFYDIAKSTIKANRRNFKSISMMKEGFTKMRRPRKKEKYHVLSIVLNFKLYNLFDNY